MTDTQEENFPHTKKYFFIFDFDGVLGDTWPGTVVGTKVLNKHDSLSFDEVGNLVKNYFSRKWDTTRNENPSEAKIAQTRDWIVEHGQHVLRHKETGLFWEFIREIARYLGSAQLAVVSSGARSYVEPLCKESGLPFTHVLTYEHHHSKEEKVETVCRDWGVELSCVYYFTDTLADVYELQTILPKERIIGVDWGFLGGEALLQELPKEQILWKPEDLQTLFPI